MGKRPRDGEPRLTKKLYKKLEEKWAPLSLLREANPRARKARLRELHDTVIQPAADLHDRLACSSSKFRISRPDVTPGTRLLEEATKQWTLKSINQWISLTDSQDVEGAFCCLFPAVSRVKDDGEEILICKPVILVYDNETALPRNRQTSSSSTCPRPDKRPPPVSKGLRFESLGAKIKFGQGKKSRASRNQASTDGKSRSSKTPKHGEISPRQGPEDSTETDSSDSESGSSTGSAGCRRSGRERRHSSSSTSGHYQRQNDGNEQSNLHQQSNSISPKGARRRDSSTSASEDTSSSDSTNSGTPEASRRTSNRVESGRRGSAQVNGSWEYTVQENQDLADQGYLKHKGNWTTRDSVKACRRSSTL